MAAAYRNFGLGAGPMAGGSSVAKSLAALNDLSTTIPVFVDKLQSKEQLEEHQRSLARNGGTIEKTGNMAESVTFRVDERIGEGTFCVVFRGDLLSLDKEENINKPVAVKFELRKTDSTQLRNEYRMYKRLSDRPGFAKIYSFGEVNFHKVLVMDLLGPSLESVFQDHNRKFTIKTVAMAAKQMLSRIQTVHEGGLIYRDIKPENFLVGLASEGGSSSIYVVDFGMAKIYRDPDTNEHIPYGEAQSLSGTARYMSINAHCRRSQSRRDDLEALGHVFMYFLRGNLPWQGIKAPAHDQRYEIMCEKKIATTIPDLCGGYPSEFGKYLEYTRGLTFDGDPDYDYLIGLFDKVLADHGEIDDGIFDWIKPKEDEAVKLPEDEAPEKEEISVVQTLPAAIIAPIIAPPAVTILETMPEENPDLTPGDAALIVPSSPPGKRRRSEFSSDLKPPVRIRPKKTTFALYDTEAQKALNTLYREVMAKRYSFHRSVGRSTRPGSSASAVAAVAAAAAAASAAATKSNSGPPSFSRPVAPPAQLAGAAITPAFSQHLDKNLGAIISELEDMADKLLQGGDWTGVARVRGWFAELATLVQKETERINQAEKQREEAEKADEAAAGVASVDAAPAAEPEPASTTVKVLAVDDLLRKDQAFEAPASTHGPILEADPDIIEPRAETAGKTPTGNTDPPQQKMNDLSIDVDTRLDVDDDEGDDDDDNTFALVYRTASGSQRVVRFAEGQDK